MYVALDSVGNSGCQLWCGGIKVFIAYDINKNRVDVRDAVESEQYFCPGCGAALGIKGKESHRRRIHYFHKKNDECSYAVDHDMSEWHYQWQEKFPFECREIPIPKDRPVHRADVLINERVLEFQHSPIQEKDYFGRTMFYTLCGLEVVWLFDMTEHCKEIRDGEIVLKKRNTLFREYDIRKSGYSLLFEVKKKIYLINAMDSSSGHYLYDGIFSEEDFVAVGCMPKLCRAIFPVQHRFSQKPQARLSRGPREWKLLK